MKSRTNLFGVCFLLFTCMIILSCSPDLNVENQNQTDRERMLSSPEQTETIVGSAFHHYWRIYSRHVHVVHMLSCIADEMTSSWCVANHISSEPRQAWNNSPADCTR